MRFFSILSLYFLTLVLGVAAAAPTTTKVLDGDTIVVGREHVRLLAIDAPELPGHCRVGRHCVIGDAVASRAALRVAVASGSIVLVRQPSKDRWGRTVADVMVNGQSLSCSQMAGGFAAYWPRYDTGGRVKRECPDVVAKAPIQTD